MQSWIKIHVLRIDLVDFSRYKVALVHFQVICYIIWLQIIRLIIDTLKESSQGKWSVSCVDFTNIKNYSNHIRQPDLRLYKPYKKLSSTQQLSWTTQTKLQLLIHNILEFSFIFTVVS